MKTTQGLIPVLTSAAGLCLTAQDWQRCGVCRASLWLEDLLIKPGLTAIQAAANLPQLYAWCGDFVLNATLPTRHRDGYYHLQSPYDGARIRCSPQEIVDIVLHLQPDGVILPEGFCTLIGESAWDGLANATQIFIPAEDMKHYPSGLVSGLYYTYNESTLDQISQQQQECPGITQYVAGTIDRAEACHLLAHGATWVESDTPAHEAMLGRVYTDSGVVDLHHTEFTQQFDVLDAFCPCPACSQCLTRAYLHHLIQHVPLLCCRLLIQHNLVSHLRAVELSL